MIEAATTSLLYYPAAATVTSMTPWEYWTWPIRLRAIIVVSVAIIWGLILITVMLKERTKNGKL